MSSELSADAVHALCHGEDGCDDRACVVCHPEDPRDKMIALLAAKNAELRKENERLTSALWIANDTTQIHIKERDAALTRVAELERVALERAGELERERDREKRDCRRWMDAATEEERQRLAIVKERDALAAEVARLTPVIAAALVWRRWMQKLPCAPADGELALYDAVDALNDEPDDAALAAKPEAGK
jgi:hypothetical protein